MPKTLTMRKAPVAKPSASKAGNRTNGVKPSLSASSLVEDSTSIPVMTAELLDGDPAIPQTAPEPVTRALPTHEEIAAHAYILAEARLRAGLQGDSVSDWYQAEEELRGTASSRS